MTNATLRSQALQYVVVQSRSYLQLLETHRAELRLDPTDGTPDLLAAIDRAEAAVTLVNAIGTNELRKLPD